MATKFHRNDDPEMFSLTGQELKALVSGRSKTKRERAEREITRRRHNRKFAREAKRAVARQVR